MHKEQGIVVGIDASRNRSGGAQAHLAGILEADDPLKHGIREIHLWTYLALMKSIPDRPWLIRHSPKELEGSLISQVWWQSFKFPSELKKAGCSIVLNTDAGTVSGYRPSVTMSRDMLSYEPGEIERYGLTRARLRLILLRYIQNRSLRNSDGVIFLSRHAADVIQRSCGRLSRIAHIPHGVGNDFKSSHWEQKDRPASEKPIRCLYVSNTAMYKHQWVVVRAIADLRRRGHKLELVLAGGGSGRAQRLLDSEIATRDPAGSFVKLAGVIPKNELPRLLARADLFIFASSCENMPNTLIEAMAVGLPIACSNRGPMPEVLGHGGEYFDPEDPCSIADAVERIIKDQEFRSSIAQKAKDLSEQFSWTRCANETWEFIIDTYRSVKK